MTDRTIAGRYQLVREIGEGGLAQVYEATDLQLQRRVAIKLLRQALASDPAIVERFHQEAQVAARLAHPNIVQIYDVGRDLDQPYIIMELVDGRPLQQYVDDEAPFTLSDTLTVLRQLADALDYAHEHGVLHRDLKPQNVLFSSDGRIKLGDFGLARGSGAATLTGQSGLLGSARYLAPEQVQGAAADARADVYALGVMAYEMLTGRLPFLAETPLEMAAQHLHANPPAPSRFNSRLPRQVDVTVLKAIAKDPNQRFRSATDFVDSLSLAHPSSEPLLEADQPTRVLPIIPTPQSPTAARPAGEPTVMMPLAPRPHKVRSYWAGILVGILGSAIVIAAFLAGQQALRTTPLALPSDLGSPTIRSASSQPIIRANSSGTPLPSLVFTPAATDTPTPSGSVTPTATDTPLATDTPAATDTPVPAASPSAPGQAAASASAPTATATTAPNQSQAVVPDVVGLTEAQAQSTIQGAGLTATFPNYQNFTAQPPGHVLSETPKAGTIVSKGTTVYIAVRR